MPATLPSALFMATELLTSETDPKTPGSPNYLQVSPEGTDSSPYAVRGAAGWTINDLDGAIGPLYADKFPRC